MFGKNLEFFRREARLSQEELGEKINVTKATVSNWEHNKSFPDGAKLIELATFFGITTDRLLGISVEDKKNIDKINQILKETNMLRPDETVSEEELKIAIDQVKQYRELFKRVLETENKYIEQPKDTK